jgi:UDP-N-acetylglucosamine--N-acetylmuramyl-(pentapeptide) pyrophosphoryl-undecaprenol N-acetylglucosamine transferase
MKKTKDTYRFLISGGGTGGHIFPALSIAGEIRKRLPEAEILFAGAENRMEMQRVPQAGYPIKGLPIAGLQRKLTLKNLLLPFKILKSLIKANEIISEFKPDAVIGTGGYASAPVVWMAQMKGIPTYVQEQNSYPGLTNRFLARRAKKIFTAYEEVAKFFPANKTVLTGNPVRESIKDVAHTPKHYAGFGLKEGIPVVLILGGSLGAASINKQVAEWVNALEKHPGFQVLWQTGKLYYERYKDLENGFVKIVPFIKEMNVAYALADIIVSRAGAGTLSELAIVGKPVILIPSVNVSEDHQTKNARALEKQNAAILLPEAEAGRLFTVVKELLEDEKKRNELSENIKKTALPDAVQYIVDEIFKDLKIE